MLATSVLSIAVAVNVICVITVWFRVWNLGSGGFGV